MLVIDAHSLLTESEEHLAEQGQNLRYRLNDLVQVFGARLPVYFIITGAQAIPGLLQWGQALTPAQRQQPLGLLSQQRSQGATAFLDEVFTGLASAWLICASAWGCAAYPTRKRSACPSRSPPCARGWKNYSSQPSMPVCTASRHCFRVCFSPRAQKMPKGEEGWFSHALLATLWPGQRYAYQPIDSWHRWRRLMVHAAVVAWLMAAAAAGTLWCMPSAIPAKHWPQQPKSRPRWQPSKQAWKPTWMLMRRFAEALLNMMGTTAARLAQAVAFFRHIERCKHSTALIMFCCLTVKFVRPCSMAPCRESSRCCQPRGSRC